MNTLYSISITCNYFLSNLKLLDSLDFLETHRVKYKFSSNSDRDMNYSPKSAAYARAKILQALLLQFSLLSLEIMVKFEVA